MEQKSKILSYLGFALKARKVRCGVNAVSTLKGGVKVLILCSTASDNTVKDAVKLAKRFSATLLVSDIPLEKITGKENCKLIAVEDDNFSKAILNNTDSHFTVYSGRFSIND